MSKSLYSLILSDEVVARIDRLALRNGTNRSALVNSILAEYTSMTTPEKRIDSVFRTLEGLLSSEGELVPFFTPNRTSMSLKSSLEYKYRPTIRYEVQLYREPGNTIGELTVSFRTQSRGLLEATESFFLFWKRLEEAYLSRLAPAGTPVYAMQDGRLVRSLSLCKNRDCSPDSLASAISAYVRLFDSQLKGFINGSLTPAQIENNYAAYLAGGPIIL
ncbi:MAG: hypothetical protein IKM29_04505 [Clostridia bacterium]|nr:hypothetical protein [Clostridia bacterium]